MRQAWLWFLVLAVSMGCQATFVSDPCFRRSAGSPSIQFDLGSAEEMWEHLPGLGAAPELTRGDAPVTVVVFEGVHRGVPAYGAALREDRQGERVVFHDVVCVITVGGPQFYADVDLTDLSLDGLDVHRYEPP
jgi:hypothetical protein